MSAAALLAALFALFGLGAAWLAPGAVCAARLGLGDDRLERFVLAAAIGRLLLALVSLLAVPTLGPSAIQLWSLAALILWLGFGRRLPKAAPGAPFALPAAVAVASAALLVVAVVARSGLVSGDGSLIFFGRDSANDPLVYASLALQVYEQGLPIHFPFIGGATTTSTYLPYGVMVGLHALGTPMLDVALRVVPFADAALLALTAVALVRRLGGDGLAACFGSALVVLGGPALFFSFDSWALFGPYLLAFNPGTAALQSGLAALLLLAARGRVGRAAPLVAGLLVAALFEIKLFVWAPLFAALAVVTWWRPPEALAPRLRAAFAVACLAVLPSLIEKLWWARELEGRDVTRFEACFGCLPRYLADASLGGSDLSFRVFESFEVAELAKPELWLATGASSLLLLVVALGARLFAVPRLWRGLRADTTDPGVAVLNRCIGLGASLGIGASLVFTTAPHYLNGAQFSWLATVGLWPFAALVFAGWWRERRIAALLLACLLIAPGSWQALGTLGLGAPRTAVVDAQELAFAEAMRSHVAPGERVLEPSMLSNTDFPSPVTWRAGRSVVLSLLSAAQVLPEAELFGRHEQVVAVFADRAPGPARAAIAASGAHWVYAPTAWPLRFDARETLEEVERSPAGILYRVRPGSADVGVDEHFPKPPLAR